MARSLNIKCFVNIRDTDFKYLHNQTYQPFTKSVTGIFNESA